MTVVHLHDKNTSDFCWYFVCIRLCMLLDLSPLWTWWCCCITSIYLDIQWKNERRPKCRDIAESFVRSLLLCFSGLWSERTAGQDCRAQKHIHRNAVLVLIAFLAWQFHKYFLACINLIDFARIERGSIRNLLQRFIVKLRWLLRH